MKLPDFELSTICDQLFSANTYIAHFDSGEQCLVIDPGLEPQAVLVALDAGGLSPGAILNTHGHADAVAGNDTLKKRWSACPLVIGAGDAGKLTDPQQNLSAPFGIPLISPEADVLVTEPETYRAAGFELEVLDTPGHSCGHVVFVWKGGSPWVVFTGDVLFQGNIGRSDFPDGSFQQLEAAIHDKLFRLPDDTIVLPGHGPPTTIGAQKRTNPFVGAPAGYRG